MIERIFDDALIRSTVTAITMETVVDKAFVGTIVKEMIAIETTVKDTIWMETIVSNTINGDDREGEYRD